MPLFTTPANVLILDEPTNDLDLDTLEVLAQSLGGFHDALRQLRHGLQLPPIKPTYLIADPPTSAPTRDAVAAHIDGLDPLALQHLHAPDFGAPDQGFLPIRAGQLQIVRLWIVDTFGQTLKLIDDESGDYELMAASGLPGPSRVTGSPRLIPLPPRDRGHPNVPSSVARATRGTSRRLRCRRR